MRSLILGISTVLFAVPAAFLACSSEAPATTESNVTADAGNAKTEEEDNPPKETADPAPVQVVTDGGSDASAIKEGTNEGDAGSQCLPDSIRESETNNDVATADLLPSKTVTYCGRLGPNDADFVKFVMPEQVGEFRFQIDSVRGGGIQVQPSAGGEPFNFQGRYPFKPGADYVLKLSSNRAVEYRLRITIE